jgi:hypothetical protein
MASPLAQVGAGPLPAGVLAGPVTVSVDAQAVEPAINEALVGVDGPGPAGASGAMAALGVHWVRTDASFEGSFDGHPDYDCATGKWDPADLDSRVERAHRQGAQALVIVDYTPPCLAEVSVPGDNVDYYPPDIGADRVRWDRLVFEMAYHEITVERVRAFEIWNEPDGLFWRGTLALYLHLYQDTATVLEQAAKAAGVPIEVGGPGLFFPDPTWIEPFLAFVVSERLPLNFLSWHWYADYPLFGPIAPIPAPPKGTPPFWYNPLLRAQTYGEQVNLVRSEVAKYPSLHPLLWIDEWNADAGYDPRMNGPFDAALAAAALSSMQQAGLDRSCFFDVADDASNYLSNWGLLSAPPALSPKPVYSAFRWWHDLAGRQLSTAVSPSQGLGGLITEAGAVASVAVAGEVRVLVYNFVPYDLTGSYGASDPTPYDRSFAVAVSGLHAGVRYSWSRSVLDGEHGQPAAVGSGVVTGPTATLRFDLAGEGLSLITLSPEGADEQ